jgi:phosphomethylpyrimidine synthase
MRITEDVRKYAAEQGIAEEEALKKGMEAKSKEFAFNGARLCEPQQCPNSKTL